MAQLGFWDNQKKAQEVVDTLKRHKQLVDPYNKIKSDFDAVIELMDLVSDNDAVSFDDLQELANEVSLIEKEVDRLEFERVFSGPLDELNSIVSINAGAGGTESCDWVSMLFRMYQRWAEKNGYTVSIIDLLTGEEAGIKNVTFFVRGSLSFGYLKAERGVHRLVRISPFDSNQRRHTSFASVDVMAEVENVVDIEIDPNDLKIDTYRAGGAGGQHVNKTDSAVRITHMPTGLIVQCQNERSQFKNKATAMKVLKARMYQKKMQEEEKERQKQYGEKMEIAWGSQIRSYVFQPYSMVKDHRSNHETSNVHAVMDGDIIPFMEAYLKSSLQKK